MKTINVENYKWMVDAISTVLKYYSEGKNDLCVILPTGMGKSIIAQEIVKSLIKEGKSKKVLYLAPNEYITSQTQRHWDENGLKDYVDYMTYPALLACVNNGDLYQFSQYDQVVIDELHRLGATEWGRAFEIVRFMYSFRILGLTATEKRYLDNGRDMAVELFEEEGIAYKMSNANAWKDGCQLPPDYIISNLDQDKEFEKLEKSLSKIKDPEVKKQIKDQIDELKADWKRTNGIPGIIKKYLIDERSKKGLGDLKKLLVFHTEIKETPEIKELITKFLQEAGFKKIRFYICNTSTNALEELEKFNEEEYDGLKVMLSIDMLLEGLHIKECDAEIMFRSTVSKNYFLQMIGRVQSFMNTTPSTVIDLVQNIVLCEEEGSFNFVPSAVTDVKSDDEEVEEEEEEHLIFNTVHDYRLPFLKLQELISDYDEVLLEWLKRAEEGDLSWMNGE